MGKHPGGRPTKYDPQYAELLPEMFKDGQSVVEVCVELGIHKDTFYDWCAQHKEFSDAYVLGLMYSEAWWQKLGRAGAAGGKVSPPLWRMNMMNRFKWSDRIDVSEDIRAANFKDVADPDLSSKSYDERVKMVKEWLSRNNDNE